MAAILIDRAKRRAVEAGNTYEWRGIPNAAPQEKLARPRPRNAKGEVAHQWNIAVG